MNNIRPEGWATSVANPEHPTYTMHGASFMVTPPVKEGFVCYWIARHGLDYTVWTYCTDAEFAVRESRRKARHAVTQEVF